MKKFNLLLFSILLVGIFLLGTFPAVLAQDEDEEAAEEFTLEEITVTAEKREENLQAVPRSLAVITADDLQMRSADTLQSMIENTAGISFVAGGPWLRHIGMRGVIPNTAETGTEAPVQFSVDGNVALGMENSISPMFSSMMDVERIEVIRGPSGAVNGRMAAVGSIRVITTDPDFEKVDGYVGYTYGDYDTNNAKAAINVPLKLTGLDLPGTLENLAVRFAVSQDKHSEYILNSAGEGVSGSADYYTWRTKLKWQPMEDVTLNAQMTYNRSRTNPGMGVPLINDGDNPHPDDPWLNATGNEAGEPSESIQWNESATADWSSGLGTLTGRYSHSWIPVECTEDSPQPCYEGERYQKEYEIYMNSPSDSKLRWMLGGYYFHKKEYAGPDSSVGVVDLDALDIRFTDFYGSGQAGGPPGPDNPNAWEAAGWYIDEADFPANNPEAGWLEDVGYLGGEVTGDSIYYYSTSATRPIDSYSYYGNITIPLFEDTQRFALGYRQNIEKKKRVMTFAIIGSDVEGDMPHFTFEDEDGDGVGTWVCDNFNTIYYEEEPHEMNTDDSVKNYTIGYEWDVITEVMLYANINNGFKPGGISLNSIPNVFYEPEKSMNYAIGTRSRWFDNTVQLNVEAYLMKYDNYQINIASEGVLTNTINGVEYTQPMRFQSRTMNMGPTNIYGIELDYDWLITAKDRVKGNFEYKHAYYGELDIYRGKTVNPPGSSSYVSYGGRVMQNSPKYTFYLSYNHRFTFYNIMVTPTFDVRYSSKYFCNSEPWWEVLAPNEIWQDSYWKYDAYLNVAPTDGKWQVNAYGKNLTETVIRNFVGGSANIQAPRTFGVGLTINF